MKAILMSIKPKYVAKILNGEKTIEIRKRFPSDYVGWVYIYCTKDKKDLLVRYIDYDYSTMSYYGCWINQVVPNNEQNRNEESKYCHCLNGKVVARFWCGRVENYVNGSKLAFENGTYIFGTNADYEYILKPSCLTEDELYDYCEDLSFKAIHISKLEIFDEPKEISEFHKIDNSCGDICFQCPHLCTDDSVGYSFDSCDLKECEKTRLTRAPQSFCFIEI